VAAVYDTAAQFYYIGDAQMQKKPCLREGPTLRMRDLVKCLTALLLVVAFWLACQSAQAGASDLLQDERSENCLMCHADPDFVGRFQNDELVSLYTDVADYERSIEEKLEYWALLWGQMVMGITGFVMWFPLVITEVLPGQVFPAAQLLHRWEAILAALAILTWHMYHGCIKDKNRSIFTGLMSEEEMQHMHPLEYQRILAADAYLKRIAEVNGAAAEAVERDRIEVGAAPSPGS
jgi:hypothetical protein